MSTDSKKVFVFLVDEFSELVPIQYRSVVDNLEIWRFWSDRRARSQMD